jgi:glycosyltransferase involved in cell wall biosynthesis
MRMPPDLQGHGGSQRAWHLVEALRPHGEIHFVLLCKDQEFAGVDLAALTPLVASITRINLGGAADLTGGRLISRGPSLGMTLTLQSHEAPRLNAAALRRIAALLPLRDPDLIFAGRLGAAVIMQALIDRRLLHAAPRVVDFDDIMSQFRRRQLGSAGPSYSLPRRLLVRLDAAILARAERRIATLWQGVGVCSEADARRLVAAGTTAVIVKLPNVVVHPMLPTRRPDGNFNLLFVGNLSFSPNQDGLTAFVEQAWDDVLDSVPQARLAVVGFKPSGAIRALVGAHRRLSLHADVPDVTPFYAAADVVIAPIRFGSGTRIKILEAMAFGRAVVSTSLGAEGLGLEHRRHLMIADSMQDFVDALAELARHPARRRAIALAARQFQEREFSPAAMQSAVAALLTAAGHHAPADRAARPEAARQQAIN